jgi:hypothetical protein
MSKSNEQPLNLWQKLDAITKEVEAIPKNGHNKFSNYKYVRAVDVVEEVRKLMNKYGVTLVLDEKELSRSEHGKNFHSILKGVGRFRNIDAPLEVEEVGFFGIAADTLDKDVYKAKTGAFKYILTQTFKIPSDDLIDPEEDKNDSKLHANKVSPTVTIAKEPAPEVPASAPPKLGGGRVGFGARS